MPWYICKSSSICPWWSWTWTLFDVCWCESSSIPSRSICSVVTCASNYCPLLLPSPMGTEADGPLQITLVLVSDCHPNGSFVVRHAVGTTILQSLYSTPVFHAGEKECKPVQLNIKHMTLQFKILTCLLISIEWVCTCPTHS